MRARLSTFVLTAAVAMTALVNPAAAAAAGTKWVGAPMPPLPSDASSATFRDVTVLSPTDVWAAGSWWDPAEHALLSHWDGTAWSKGPVVAVDPAPVPEEYGLSGVDGVSSADVWAVGKQWPQGGQPEQSSSLILHDDGTAWDEVATPSQPAGAFSELTDVDMLSSTDGWAVGQSQATGHDAQPLILRWQAGSWAAVPVPILAGTATLTSVYAASPVDAWVAGSQVVPGGVVGSLVLHWDGVTWSQVSLPRLPGGLSAAESLAGIAEGAPGDVWAVGSTCGVSCGPLVLHLSGEVWQRVAAAAPAATLTDVVANSPSDVWVVGQAGAASTTINHVEHWDGVQFSTDTSTVSPMGLGSALALAAAAADRTSGAIWAVGWIDHPDRSPNAIHRG